jgi:hypothetical protein
MCWNWYRPFFISPNPIVVHDVRSCIKQTLDRKIKQQQMLLVNVGAERRLKVKEGTHKTFSRVIKFESLTVPMFFTGISCPFGSLTL